MEGENTTALDKRASDRTRDIPSRGHHQLKTKTPKSKEDRYASEKPQAKTPASRSRNDERDDRYVKVDDDDGARDGGNSGDEGDEERNESINEVNDSINFDGIKDKADIRDEYGIESESESFFWKRTTRGGARFSRQLAGKPKKSSFATKGKRLVFQRTRTKRWAIESSTVLHVGITADQKADQSVEERRGG